MHPAHLVFVFATKESPEFLCKKIAVNSLLLTHGGLQSPADNKRRKFISLTKTLITEAFKTLSVICLEIQHANNPQPATNFEAAKLTKS